MLGCLLLEGAPLLESDHTCHVLREWGYDWTLPQGRAREHVPEPEVLELHSAHRLAWGAPWAEPNTCPARSKGPLVRAAWRPGRQHFRPATPARAGVMGRQGEG